MKALILTENEAEDIEVLYPYYRLQEEGIEVHVASTKKGQVTFKHGYWLNADLAFEDVNPDEYDILILPGGRGPERVRLNKAALEIVKKFSEKSKPIAAICHGPQILISANLVKGRKLTSWHGIRDDVIAAGGIYEDRPVVKDGNLITSRQPSDLPFWLSELVKMIKG
ncbi:MAG: type 1 glutamine amidotransferase domain-containing protein [Nitrososphaeria archaeon]|nr:type 1 glutamine amidotransferase domain-containing protein [Conexivisphaerales archaeon]